MTEQAIGINPLFQAIPWGTLSLLFLAFWVGTVVAEWREKDFWLRRNFEQFFDLCEFYPVATRIEPGFDPGPNFKPQEGRSRQFQLVKLPFKTLRASQRIRFRIRVYAYHYFTPSQLIFREWIPEVNDVLGDSRAALELLHVCSDEQLCHFLPIQEGSNFVSLSQGMRLLYVIEVFQNDKPKQRREILIQLMDRPGQFYTNGPVNQRFSDGGKFVIYEDNSKPISDAWDVINLLNHDRR